MQVQEDGKEKDEDEDLLYYYSFATLGHTKSNDGTYVRHALVSPLLYQLRTFFF